MIINLHGGNALATSEQEAKQSFLHGKFREATMEEAAQALKSFSNEKIQNDPETFRNLAVAIARFNALVGTLKPA